MEGMSMAVSESWYERVKEHLAHEVQQVETFVGEVEAWVEARLPQAEALVIKLGKGELGLSPGHQAIVRAVAAATDSPAIRFIAAEVLELIEVLK
jgi:hypothetical protein